MSCCPTCPEDFKVKNIPDEVDCLISNKVKANDLKNPEDYLLIANLRQEYNPNYSANPQVVVDLSGAGITPNPVLKIEFIE